MFSSTLTPILIASFATLYGGLTIGSVAWMRWRRKTRWPFKESDKLLRAPGESLGRKLREFDERFVMEFFGTIAVGILSFPVGAIVVRWTGFAGLGAMVVLFAGPVLVAMGSAWRITRIWKERSNHYLGWFGERVTGEHLRSLQSQGYRVFHDFPCEGGTKGFNIDHVVVGPTGVTVVETKTRRKGNARQGCKDYEVVFDGKSVIWPSGPDRRAIAQVIGEGDWLEKWIFAQTGMKVTVKRVFTLPGWFVRESPSAALRVVNPKFLPDAIRGFGETTLTAPQIDLIARQIEIRCRDVDE